MWADLGVQPCLKIGGVHSPSFSPPFLPFFLLPALSPLPSFPPFFRYSLPPSFPFSSPPPSLPTFIPLSPVFLSWGSTPASQLGDLRKCWALPVHCQMVLVYSEVIICLWWVETAVFKRLTDKLHLQVTRQTKILGVSDTPNWIFGG